MSDLNLFNFASLGGGSGIDATARANAVANTAQIAVLNLSQTSQDALAATKANVAQIDALQLQITANVDDSPNEFIEQADGSVLVKWDIQADTFLPAPPVPVVVDQVLSATSANPVENRVLLATILGLMKMSDTATVAEIDAGIDPIKIVNAVQLKRIKTTIDLAIAGIGERVAVDDNAQMAASVEPNGATFYVRNDNATNKWKLYQRINGLDEPWISQADIEASSGNGSPWDFSLAGTGSSDPMDILGVLNQEYMFWTDDSGGTLNDGYVVRLDDLVGLLRTIIPVADQAEENDVRDIWNADYAGYKIYRKDLDIYKDWDGFKFVLTGDSYSKMSMLSGTVNLITSMADYMPFQMDHYAAEGGDITFNFTGDVLRELTNDGGIINHDDTFTLLAGQTANICKNIVGYQMVRFSSIEFEEKGYKFNMPASGGSFVIPEWDARIAAGYAFWGFSLIAQHQPNPNDWLNPNHYYPVANDDNGIRWYSQGSSIIFADVDPDKPFVREVRGIVKWKKP